MVLNLIGFKVRKFFFSLVFLASKILRCGIVRSFYGPFFKSNFADLTFKFYIRGDYGDYYFSYLVNFPKDFIFIDVGANQGLYSIAAALNKNRPLIFAFEPVRRSMAFLKCNALINRVDKIVFVNAAIDASSGYKSITKIGGHSGAATFRSMDEGQDAVECVPCLNSTDLLKLFGGYSVAGASIIVKIDTEGHELQVLGELSKLPLWDQVNDIFVEVDEAWVSYEDISDFLSHHGFSISKIGSGQHYDLHALR